MRFYVCHRSILPILTICDKVMGSAITSHIMYQLRSHSTFVSRYNLIFLLVINYNILVKPLLALLCQFYVIMILWEQERSNTIQKRKVKLSFANMQLQNDVKLAKKSKKKFHQTITIDNEEKIQVISTNEEGWGSSSGKSK